MVGYCRRWLGERRRRLTLSFGPEGLQKSVLRFRVGWLPLSPPYQFDRFRELTDEQSARLAQGKVEPNLQARPHGDLSIEMITRQFSDFPACQHDNPPGRSE